MKFWKECSIRSVILIVAFGVWPIGGSSNEPSEISGSKQLHPELPGQRSSPDIGPGQIHLRINRNRVSVDLHHAALAEAMNKFTAESGIHVWVSDAVKGNLVTDRFQDLPMEQALKRLLQGLSFALVYDGDGDNRTVARVFVVANADDPPSTAPGQAAVIQKFESKALIESLDPGALPDGVRTEMLEASAPITPELRQKLSGSKQEALTRLLRQLESGSAKDSEATRQLREKLQQSQSELKEPDF